MARRTQLLLFAFLMAAVPAAAQSRGDALRCTPGGDLAPAAALGRTAAALGLDASDQPLRVRAWRATINDFQSDRSYPPFFASFESAESFFDPRAGALAARRRGGAYPGNEFPPSPAVQISGPWAAWFARDTLTFPAGSGAEARALDPWAVAHDFLRTPNVRAEGLCRYRDFPRLALARDGVFGAERLLVDPSSFIPVALVREEPHYLWGQVRVEYVWSNWDRVDGGGMYPLTAFRVIDGETSVTQTATSHVRVARDSTPRLVIPDTALRGAPLLAAFAQPRDPDTVRVGPATWLLVNPSYTITVTLQRDTVFVLDATLGEPRARQDAAWVAKLFPGRHPVVLVVTDLAWPHIAGMRYWVASGATVAAHRSAEPFLRRVAERRWTRAPDLLETTRARARFRFRAVDDSMSLAGGAIVLHAINGISSEGALLAWLPGDAFLWASDYIQDIRGPSEYAHEVIAAARRAGVAPARFAAQHVRLTPWNVIDSLNR